LLNPVAPFVVGVSTEFGNKFQRLLGNGYLYWMMISPLAWSALVMAVSLRELRHDRKIIKKNVPSTPKVTKRSLLGQVWCGLLFVPVFRFMGLWLATAPADRWLGFEIINPLWQRARRAMVHDREMAFLIPQLVMCVVIIVGLALKILFDVLEMPASEFVKFLLLCLWLILFLFAITLTSIGLALDRGRGIVEQLLVTPITPRELVQGALLMSWQRWYLTCLALIAVVVLSVALGYHLVWEAIVMLVIGFVSLAVFLLEAIACSLVARSLVAGLFSGFAIPVTLWAAFPMLARTWHVNYSAMLLVVVIVLPASWALMRWRKDNFTIPFYLGSVHLGFVLLASVLMLMRFDPFSGWSRIEGGILFRDFGLLEHRHFGAELWSDWVHAVGCYCLTQLLFLVWLYRWLIRNVDVLVGRMPSNSPVEWEQSRANVM